VKGAPTVSSYYGRWLETLEISKASRYDYQCLGHAYIDRTRLGPMEVANVGATDIREVVKASTSLRRTTMLLQRLRAMFDAAIDDGLIDRNPAARVKNPKRRTPAETIEPFTKAEVAKIVAAAQGMDRALVVTMLGTGAGPGELLAVRRTDIDLESKQLQIRGSYGRFGEGATKTPGRVRVIDLVDVVVPVIATLREHLATPSLHEPVFANQRGGFLNFVNWRGRNWKELLERAGVAYRNPYACRHTYAVRMLEAGFNPIHVALQMGHTGPEMVYRHYARWTSRNNQAANNL
jgi:integrase